MYIQEREPPKRKLWSRSINDMSKDVLKKLRKILLKLAKVELDSIGINTPVNLEDPIENIEYGGKSWKELLISHSNSAKEMLNEVWAKYNLYFDLETVAHISELLNDEFYNERLLSLRKVLDDDIKTSEFVN